MNTGSYLIGFCKLCLEIIMTKICDNRALGFEMNEEVPSVPNFVQMLSFPFIYYVLEYHFSQDGYMCGCYIILQNLCMLWNYVLNL